jgi:yeast amino acid transporter
MTLNGRRYCSRTMGFALGYLYFYSLGILVPYEITAAALVFQYWHVNVNIAVFITVFIIIIVGLNALPVRFYGETEFWFASTKVLMMIGLLLLSFILFWGGGPNRDRLGFRYWKHPGAANTYLVGGNTGRFLALLSTLVLSAFPFTFAPELVVVTAGEMKNPRRNLPIAARRYAYRLFFFYIGCVLAIGVICPSTASALTSKDKGAGSSAFVVAIKNAGIPVLDSIINALIIISAWSSGNSFLYLSSRSLYALALSGNAPRFFKACSKTGVPYWCVFTSSLFCLLAYLNVGHSSGIVFNWFVNLTNTSGFISWICCSIIYLRFRKATRLQGITDLPYRSRFQPWGSWLAMISFIFLCLINGFDVFLFKAKGAPFNVSDFFTAYIGIPIFLVIYFGHRVYDRKAPWAIPAAEVDLKSGLAQVLAEEEPLPVRRATFWSWLTRIWE